MRVAVFGKPGGGKSSLCLDLASVCGLPLHQLDRIQYLDGGHKIPDEEFLAWHAKAIAADKWVIDGYGIPQSFESLLRAADVLVYIDRGLFTHYWWVTKRLIKSPAIKPPGWPDKSPMLRSTLSGYRHLWRASRFWTPAFQQRLLALGGEKRVFIIKRQADVKRLLRELAPDRV